LDKPYTFGYSGTCERYVHDLVSFDVADPIPTSFAGAVAPLTVVPVQAAKDSGFYFVPSKHARQRHLTKSRMHLCDIFLSEMLEYLPRGTT
jgi:hypothetical protein